MATTVSMSPSPSKEAPDPVRAPGWPPSPVGTVRRNGLRAVAVIAVLLTASPFRASADDRRGLDEIRALLAAGKPADALARAKRALASVGDDLEVLELASDAAVGAKSPDEALWFAHVARCAATRRGDDDRAKALAAKTASPTGPVFDSRTSTRVLGGPAPGD